MDKFDRVFALVIGLALLALLLFALFLKWICLFCDFVGTSLIRL